jgi:hypothetical protein
MKSEDNELPLAHKSDAESYFSVFHNVNCLHLTILRLSLLLSSLGLIIKAQWESRNIALLLLLLLHYQGPRHTPRLHRSLQAYCATLT